MGNKNGSQKFIMQPNNASDLTKDALYYDYGSSANPIFSKLISPVPYHTFSPDFFNQKISGILPLDVSKELGCPGPATSPLFTC